MVEQDTVKLLRECDAGVKMGIASLDGALDHTRSNRLRNRLSSCMSEHETLEHEIEQLLDRCHDNGKEPPPMAKGMSWVQTNIMLPMRESDAAVADFVTNGCNMGVKSLNKYLNQYKAADERSKDIAKRLIHLEEQLTADIRAYL